MTQSQKARTSGDRQRYSSWLPFCLVAFFVLRPIGALEPPKPSSAFDLNNFGRLPALEGGRIKPLDTVARASLLMLSGKQAVRAAEGARSAMEWLADMLFRPARADGDRVFQIDDPDVLGIMGIQQTAAREYSFRELQPHLKNIEAQAVQADQIKPEQRSRYQSSILNLENRLNLYQKLQNSIQVAGDDQVSRMLSEFERNLEPAMAALAAHAKNPTHPAGPLKEFSALIERYDFLAQTAQFYPLPMAGAAENSNNWASVGRAALGSLATGSMHPGVEAFAAMGDAWRAENAAAFNQALLSYRQWIQTQAPGDVTKAGYEFVFNYFEPFYQSLVIYGVVLLLVFISWLAWPETLARSAYVLLILAFAVHTVGLASRMILQGRPPVTNLYSSAIFVGWVAVLLGIELERLFRRGLGSGVAAAIGFLTLIVAHHLASEGDTLEMMRAVLDSNFWLATHVVCITIGYGSTFLSGFLATVFIFRRFFDRRWNDESMMTLDRMVYGVVCFSAFFSFLGTILGGIWADQSWGRFWGWDPKENGALMIVLWNVFILHARWGGWARKNSLMVMAVFGNIVTSLSWFGVNMLGIGLHSYGFMEKAFVWLMAFVISQLAVMALGLAPDDRTRRFAPTRSD